MATWDERVQHAKSKGWRVQEVEHYNPGGTTYTLELLDPDGVSHGRVEKYVLSRSLGKDVRIAVPDADAPAWDAVPV